MKYIFLTDTPLPRKVTLTDIYKALSNKTQRDCRFTLRLFFPLAFVLRNWVDKSSTVRQSIHHKLGLQRETDASVASQKETVTTRIYDVKYLSTFLMFIKIRIYIGSSKE